jgi:hypothetical protein
LRRRLGIDVGAVAPVDRHVEGVVEMVLDATLHCDRKLDAERLFGWHAALFPTGHSGRTKIRVAQWRDDASGAMQVVRDPSMLRRSISRHLPPRSCGHRCASSWPGPMPTAASRR